MSTFRLRATCALAALALSGSTDAVTLARNGIGQALIYPYYTVNNSQDTLISIVNPTGVGKAIQVRFLEGYDGRDVLDLVLFLAEHDVWTASISQVSYAGGALLRSSDTSCTLPPIPADGMNFTSDNYDGTAGLPDDGGPHDITRTHEGSIDFIIGGDIVPGSPTDNATVHLQNFAGFTSAPDCASLDPSAFANDLVAPTGGVYGSGSIIDVGIGTYFAYNADALADFTSVPLFGTTAAAAPPSLADANSGGVSQGATANIFNAYGRLLSVSYQASIDAVSAVFMANTIYNEYITDAALGANTDWVVTFPTKRFYVDKALYPGNPTDPFATAFAAPGEAQVDTDATIYDREEGFITQPSGCGEQCPPDPYINLAYEANVLSFDVDAGESFVSGTPSKVLGSRLTFSAIRPYGSDGMSTLDLAGGDGGHVLPGGIDGDGAAITLTGLPVDGFMVYDIVNAQAQPGLLANYGGTFAHRTTMSCAGSVNDCGPPPN